jgi:hypothetical protein
MKTRNLFAGAFVSAFTLSAAMLFGTAAMAVDSPKKGARACGPVGAPLTINGRTVCAPEPSGDLRRFATAATLAAFLGRPYADVVNDLVRHANTAKTRLLQHQAAPGSLKIDSESSIAFADIAAQPGQVISRLAVKNDGEQPLRVLIDSGEARFDFVLHPKQEFDTAALLASSTGNSAEILVAGPGRKLISGVTETIAYRGLTNRCIAFEGSFDLCAHCIGQNACFAKECLPATVKFCWAGFLGKEPVTCSCQ